MDPDIVSRSYLAALEHRFSVIILYNMTFAECIWCESNLQHARISFATGWRQGMISADSRALIYGMNVCGRVAHSGYGWRWSSIYRAFWVLLSPANRIVNDCEVEPTVLHISRI